MIRKVIFVCICLVVALGLYVSRGTFETVSAMGLTAFDLFFPSDETAHGAASSTGKDANSPNTSVTAQRFANSLMVMEDGVPHNLDASKLAKVKYWAFYYSASWCPACREDIGSMVSFYKSFKYWHPDFELIYVSQDNNSDDMLAFMKANAMPWPTVWFADIQNSELGAMKYFRGAVPTLVLVDDEGNVLTDGYMMSDSDMMSEIRKHVH